MINGYRHMWNFVFFDLPTTEPEDRHEYNQFRKNLLKRGFLMMQYSVYVRHCISLEKADAQIERIKHFLPPKGKVSILTVTDKQFGRIRNFWGVERVKNPEPQQMVLML